jgi:preprotein translocase subunit SecF
MYFMGGAAIKDFFFPMTLGIIFGTYSSVYIAAVTTLFVDTQMKKSNEHKTAKVVA